MQTQIVGVLRRPPFALSSFAIALLSALFLLYFDEFYFLAPYLTVFIPADRLPVLLLDLAISSLSGIVLSLSIYEIRTFPNLRAGPKGVGAAGIIAAFIAGACPCYYLVPLLAVAGGAGGVLGTIGILFFDYQIPIKLGSLALLVFTTFTVERALKAACEIPPKSAELEFPS
jgi:hypothetical protein